MLFTGIYNSSIAFFYYCLDLAERLHEDLTETKDMVKEIHQVSKRPDNCQSAPMEMVDRNGWPYFS